jgi:DNA-binding CsgD family transcriptional regulator
MTDLFEALVADVYDAAVDPSLWPGFLERLRGLVDCEFVSIISANKQTLEVAHMHHTQWSPQALNELAASKLAQIPVREKILFGLPDTPVSSLSLMSEKEFNRTDFYRNWARPKGLRDGASCTIAETNEHHTLLALATSRKREPVTTGELALIRQLSPHMRRAFMISEILERTRWEADLTISALSVIRMPVLICDAAGRLMFANAAGEAAFEKGGPLIARHGLVTPRAAAVQSSFAEALRRAAANDLALGLRGIGMPLAAQTGGGAHAYILPLQGSGARRISGSPLVAVFLSTDKGRALPEEPVLMTLFDLTPAEARVMTRVGQGHSASAVKEALGVSPNTVKTQLSQIFRKTGCSTQAELVRLMGELSLPVGV